MQVLPLQVCWNGHKVREPLLQTFEQSAKDGMQRFLKKYLEQKAKAATVKQQTTDDASAGIYD